MKKIGRIFLAIALIPAVSFAEVASKACLWSTFSIVNVQATAVRPQGQEKGLKTLMNKTATAQQRIPPGNWGGAHVNLQVAENGGSVEFDCAHGTLEQSILLDAQGRFEVAGTYEEEHGGPVRAGSAARSYPVRYAGQVKAGTMTLKIRRRDNRKLIGTFTLKQGAEAFLVKCR